MDEIRAINSKTGIYTFIGDAKKGNNYECLKCHSPVIVRDGDKNIKHYAHAENTVCVKRTSSSCSDYVSGETEDQYTARILLKNCIDTRRSITLVRHCCGYRCEESCEFIIPTEQAITTTLSKPGVDVYFETSTTSYAFDIFRTPTQQTENVFKMTAKSITENYTNERDLYFPERSIWKCSECLVVEAKQAEIFKQTRRIIFEREQYSIDFGKYKGKDLRDLINLNPLYYKWLVELEKPCASMFMLQVKARAYLKEWKLSQRAIKESTGIKQY